MKTLIPIMVAIMVFAVVPALAFAQTDQANAANPPISQPLVREGTLAVKLVDVLKLGTTTNEAEAETLLSSAGIAPHNGWMADYPVTPDIANELREDVANAATAGSLKLGKDEALAAYDKTLDQYNLAFRDDSSGKTGEAQSYPDTAVVNNYYEQGPPVVTYYAPPAAYAYLYTWVPYPFWWWNFWYPGFFVLADFHRPFFFGGRFCFVSNHFFDRDRNIFVRVNAFERFRDFHRFRDFDRFRDRSFGHRVVGPFTAGHGAENVFRRQMERSGFRDNRSGAARVSEKALSPYRGSYRTEGSLPNRMGSDRRFDGSILNRAGRSFNPSPGEKRSLEAPRTLRNFDSPRIDRNSGPSSGGERSLYSPRTDRGFHPSMGGGGRSFGRSPWR